MTPEELEEHLSTYLVPRRGIHLKASSQIVQIIPTDPRGVYPQRIWGGSFEMIKPQQRQHVIAVLQDSGVFKVPEPSDDYNISLEDSHHGKPGQLEVVLAIVKQDRYNNPRLRQIADQYGYRISLGFVPLHGNLAVKTVAHEFYKGYVHNIFDSGHGFLRIAVNFLYDEPVSTPESRLMFTD